MVFLSFAEYYYILGSKRSPLRFSVAPSCRSQAAFQRCSAPMLPNREKTFGLLQPPHPQLDPRDVKIDSERKQLRKLLPTLCHRPTQQISANQQAILGELCSASLHHTSVLKAQVPANSCRISPSAQVVDMVSHTGTELLLMQVDELSHVTKQSTGA